MHGDVPTSSRFYPISQKGYELRDRKIDEGISTLTKEKLDALGHGICTIMSDELPEGRITAAILISNIVEHFVNAGWRGTHSVVNIDRVNILISP